MAGARAHNRWLAELCQDSPERRAGVAIVPDLRPRGRGRRDHPGPRVRPAGRHPHPVDVGHRGAVPRRPVRAGVGGVRGPADARARAQRLGRQGGLRPLRRHVHHRGPLVVGPAAALPALVGRVRAPPRPALRRHRVRRLLGRRPALDDGHRRTTASTAPGSSASSSPPGCRCGRASTSTATAPSARRTPAAASWPAATRSASATSCGATTSPTPRARGRTPASSCATPSATSPSTRPRQMLGAQRGRDVRVRRGRAAAARRQGRADAGRARPGGRRPVASGTTLKAAGRPWRTGRRSPAGRHRLVTTASASTRSSRASTPGPTTSTGACARPSRSTGASCCRAGCSPASRTCRRILRDHSVSSDLDQAKPSPVVDLLRARSGRNARTARRHDPRAARRPRARPPAQAPAGPVHGPLDRAAAWRRCSERVDAHLDRLGTAGEAELIADFAYPLPVEVFCDMLGIPAEEGPRFRSWTAAVARSLDLVISEEDYDACMVAARGDGAVPVRRGRREAGRAGRRRAVARCSPPRWTASG